MAKLIYANLKTQWKIEVPTATSLEDLASKGPLEPEGIRGLDEAGYAEYLKAEDITVSDGLK